MADDGLGRVLRRPLAARGLRRGAYVKGEGMPPNSWNRKGNEEIDGDLRAYAAEHGLEDVLDDDDYEPSEAALKAARLARIRVVGATEEEQASMQMTDAQRFGNATLTSEQIALLWHRFKQGESLNNLEIEKVLGTAALALGELEHVLEQEVDAVDAMLPVELRGGMTTEQKIRGLKRLCAVMLGEEA